MTPRSILTLCFLVAPTFAQSNGMITSMDVPMDLAVGQMLPYVHFTPGDTVWILGWVPSSAGSMVGTCIGVFLLAMLERWLAACLELAEQHWAERANIMALEKSDVSSLSSSSSPSAKKSKWLQLPPFVPEFDITRGVLFTAHAFIRVLLMLIVMTFQLAFIASITVGSGVGETLFGRLALSAHEH
ncbi:Ctr copper transporter family-domain-containing protein [Butyriboletus roseoflavus]|nr:Ctr copper transporter family-domain-containing protein [Butyriboletus roseoflavus]